MIFTDVPKLAEWQRTTGRVMGVTTKTVKGVTPTAQAKHLQAIDDLIKQYHMVMPMARIHTMLDMQEEVKAWFAAAPKVAPVVARTFQAKETGDLVDAMKALQIVLERKLKSVVARPYQEIVCAAYLLKTGKTKGWKDSGGTNRGTAAGYMGEADTATDLEARCKQMIKAIEVAYNTYQAEFVTRNLVTDDAKTLKLFMAPEFYFRGKEGAFGMEVVQTVMDRLRQETKKYPHWLFVLGTLIIGSERTGVACGTCLKWLTVVADGKYPKGKIQACPQCNKPLWCATCKTGLTVFQPIITPPKYWDANRTMKCPKCKATSAFFEQCHAIEIDNFALVQKGGYGKADGVHDYCMQKETVSNLDFERPTDGDAKVKLLGFPSIEAQKPESGGAKERMGGGVFTMEGITFGLEICLDHLCERLANAPDAQRIQVQLVPSAGMEIHTGSVACVTDGIVFNVDGVRADSDVQINESGGLDQQMPVVSGKSVANVADKCFPDAANQSVEMYGPFDIPYV